MLSSIAQTVTVPSKAFASRVQVRDRIEGGGDRGFGHRAEGFSEKVVTEQNSKK